MEILLPILGSILIFFLLLPFTFIFEQVDAEQEMEKRRRVWATTPMPLPQREVSFDYRRSQQILLSAFPEEEDFDLSCLNEHEPPHFIV